MRNQSFFLFESGNIDGNSLEEGDWIASFNGDVCVGAWPWAGEFTQLAAMGDDGSMETYGYCENGSKLRFEIKQASSGKSFRVTDSTPIWRDNGIVMVNQLMANEIPKDMLIAKVYPNPFNPITEIAFEIKNKAHVQVRIYDVSGKEVSVLENGLLSAGSHKRIWDAANYSSGVYLMSIIADGISSTQKLMLMK